MALNEQKLRIDFSQGVDTGTDPKTVIPSKFTKLDNLEWDKYNTVRQRPGFEKATITAHTGSASIVNVRRLHALGEEVLLEADTGLHSFLQNRTVSRDQFGNEVDPRTKSFERAQVDFQNIAAGQRDQYGFDAAVASQSGLECWVWTESQILYAVKSVFYKVIDSVSRAVVQEGVVFSDTSGVTTAFNPRVVVRNVSGGTSTFYIYYVEAAADSRIKVKSMTIADGAKVPSALSASTDVIGAAVGGDGAFDAHYSSNGDVVVLAYQDAAITLTLTIRSGANGYTSIASNTAVVASVDAISVTVVLLSGTYYALVIAANAANTPFTFSTTLAGGTPLLTTHAAAEGLLDGRVAIMVSPFDSTKALAFYDMSPYTGTLNAFSVDVGFMQVTATGVVVASTQGTFARSVVLAARPVAYYGTVGGAVDVCVPVQLLSALQPTIFALKFGGTTRLALFSDSVTLFHVPPRVLARIFPGECGSLKTHYGPHLRLPTCLAAA